MKNTLIIFVFVVIACACSTKAYLANSTGLAGKRIAIANIDITRTEKGKTVKGDTVCLCINQTITTTLYPYLQQAGAIVIDLTNEQRSSWQRLNEAADSLKVDYVLSGTGMVHRVGKNADLIDQLAVKLVSLDNSRVIMTGSFSGFSVLPAGAAQRIGKQIVKQSRK